MAQKLLNSDLAELIAKMKLAQQYVMTRYTDTLACVALNKWSHYKCLLFSIQFTKRLQETDANGSSRPSGRCQELAGRHRPITTQADHPDPLTLARIQSSMRVCGKEFLLLWRQGAIANHDKRSILSWTLLMFHQMNWRTANATSGDDLCRSSGSSVRVVLICLVTFYFCAQRITLLCNHIFSKTTYYCALILEESDSSSDFSGSFEELHSLVNGLLICRK